MKRLHVVPWILAAITLIISGVVIFAISSQNRNDTIRIGNTTINVERAVSEAERQRGLCCRDFLAENAGMLFVYSQPGDYRFWMKDTRIPLDMYWISSEKKIVHIEQNVQPETYPQPFGTDKPAQYILETNAGFAKTHNIKVGDPVNF